MAQGRKNTSPPLQEKRPRGRRSKADAKERAASQEAAASRAASMLGLHSFTVDFFTHFGAPPEVLEGENPHGALRVQMQGALANHFGSGEMVLAFQRVETGSNQQLVAHGSKVFDAMLSWLDLQSATSVRRLPLLHAGSEPLLKAVRPRNAGITGLKLSDSREPLYLFYWRITYRADDKREEIFLVALNGEGDPIAIGSPDTLLAEKGRNRNRAMEQLQEALAASEAVMAPAPADDAESANADAPPIGSEEVINAGAIKLPPVAHLVRLAEQARKYAVWHADVRCAEHEGEILPRLYKIANRLTGYYEQQMEELNGTQSSARREALEEDLARKIDEEVENHRLRVHLELCGYVLLYTPVATAEMRLTDGKRTAPLRVRMDRFTGELHRPQCASCDADLNDVVLCRNGHVVCDGCMRQCQQCGDVLCADCGVSACPVCAKENCDQCSRECRACGERACLEHLDQCPTCLDDVCYACQEVCAECGVRQCRSHLRADAVHGENGKARLICSACAVRCPGCKQYSAQIDTCALSGQRFCRNCLVVCSECKRTVGPGFYGAMPSGRIVCRECVRLCASCGRPAEAVSHCATCGEECCEACSGRCDICGEAHCSRHIATVSACGHNVCARDALECHIGHEIVCPTCSRSCAICDRPHCTNHYATCSLCGKFYCSACVEFESGLCATCGAFALGNLPQFDIASAPGDVRRDAGLYGEPSTIWYTSHNRDVTLYLGDTGRKAKVLIEVRAKSGGGTYLFTRRLTWLDAGNFSRYRRAMLDREERDE